MFQGLANPPLEFVTSGHVEHNTKYFNVSHIYSTPTPPAQALQFMNLLMSPKNEIQSWDQIWANGRIL